MKYPDIIQDGRAELERTLLEAMFTLGAEPLAGLSQLHLVPDKLQVVNRQQIAKGCYRLLEPTK